MLSHAFAKNSIMLDRLIWTSTKRCLVSSCRSLSLSVVKQDHTSSTFRSPTAWQSDRARSTSVGSYATYMSRRCRSERVCHSSMCTCLAFVVLVFSKQIANKMRLYHHTTRCPVAMQLLLDTNPDLWCFVPMANDQAMIDDLDFFSTEAPIVFENGKKDKPVCHKSDHSNAIDRFISQVSTPLPGYSFTHRQREQQRVLFQRMLDRSFHWVGKCDLFEATIIAVRKSLDSCSTIVRSV